MELVRRRQVVVKWLLLVVVVLMASATTAPAQSAAPAAKRAPLALETPPAPKPPAAKPPIARPGGFQASSPVSSTATLVVADCYAEGDLRPEITALSLMVRSMLGGSAQVEWPKMAMVLGDKIGLYADSAAAPALLRKFGAARLLTWACVSDGLSLQVTIRLTNSLGQTEAQAIFEGWRADLPAMALAIVKQLEPVLKVAPDPSMAATFGSLWHFVRASKALLREDGAAAAAAMLGGDPVVARKLPAVGALGRAVWGNAARTSVERLAVALVTADPQTVLNLCDDLEAGVPPTELAAVRALSFIALDRIPDAEQQLDKLGPSTDPMAALVRAQLADRKKDATARDQALTTIVALRHLPGLRYIASLPPSHLSPVLEQEVVSAAIAIRYKDPALASALGFRAARRDPEGFGIELVSVQYLAEGEAALLAQLSGDAPESVSRSRLRAELRLRGDDLVGAAADADAAFQMKKSQKPDPDIALLRGRIYAAQGRHDEAQEQLLIASMTYSGAGNELARVYVADDKDEDALATWKALDPDPTSSEQAQLEAEALAKNKDYEAAITRLEDARKVGSENLSTLESMAKTYRLSGDTRKAEALEVDIGKTRATTVRVEQRRVIEPVPANPPSTNEAPKATAQIVEPPPPTRSADWDLTWLWIGLGAIVGLMVFMAALPYILGGGEVKLIIAFDEKSSDRVYCARLTKSNKLPPIKDAKAWAEKIKKGGVKIGRRSQTLIASATSFDAFPGNWRLQLWGVHQKDGELVAITPIQRDVKISRKWNEVVEIDLTPAPVECRITVRRGGAFVRDAEVWIDDGKEHGKTDEAGRVTLTVMNGARVFHAKAGEKTAQASVEVKAPGPQDVLIKL